jgi:hypothetical protein
MEYPYPQSQLASSQIIPPMDDEHKYSGYGREMIRS